MSAIQSLEPLVASLLSVAVGVRVVVVVVVVLLFDVDVVGLLK